VTLAFVIVSAVFAWLMISGRSGEQGGQHHHGGGASWIDRTLTFLALASYAWLAIGLVLWLTF